MHAIHYNRLAVGIVQTYGIKAIRLDNAELKNAAHEEANCLGMEWLHSDEDIETLRHYIGRNVRVGARQNNENARFIGGLVIIAFIVGLCIGACVQLL